MTGRITMPKITELYAWIVDEGEGDEGVPAVLTDGMWCPMIGADMERVRSLKKHAETVAKQYGKPMTFKRFVLVDD